MASGGTARVLLEAGLPVTPVEDVTGSPEMLDGRVKTLHPAIHGGLLADRRNPEHVRQLEELGIAPFDLLVGGLYPFRETVASGAAMDDVIENIDIGGPAMMRAAAKNFESVAVIVDPARYTNVLEEIELEGGLTRATRFALAAEAYAHTAAYDAAVAGWFAQQEGDAMPPFVGLAYTKVAELRYGENPHQRGALYAEAAGPGVLHGAEVLQGKEMSFNNWLDTWAALDLAIALPANACVIVKHNNPCGVAALETCAASYAGAFACDTVSAFGGIVAFHGACDADAAEAMRDVFTEVVVAPGYADEALAAFAARPNLRVVRAPLEQPAGWDVRTLPGGAVVQEVDRAAESPRGLRGRLLAGPDRTGVGRSPAGLDDRLAREIEHDRVRARRRGRRHRRRADVARRLVVDRRAEGRRPREGRRGRLRRVLPVPRRARGRGRGGLHRGDPSRGLERGRGGPRGGRGARDGRRPHGHEALPPLSERAVNRCGRDIRRFGFEGSTRLACDLGAGGEPS